LIWNTGLTFAWNLIRRRNRAKRKVTTCRDLTGFFQMLEKGIKTLLRLTVATKIMEEAC